MPFCDETHGASAGLSGEDPVRYGGGSSRFAGR